MTSLVISPQSSEGNLGLTQEISRNLKFREICFSEPGLPITNYNHTLLRCFFFNEKRQTKSPGILIVLYKDSSRLYHRSNLGTIRYLTHKGVQEGILVKDSGKTPTSPSSTVRVVKAVARAGPGGGGRNKAGGGGGGRHG